MNRQKETVTKLEMNKSNFEEILARDGRLFYTNVGDSMMPLIKQGRDLLVIEKTTRKPKKYDIPLYKRDNGQYVLHRILKVRENDYVICGDNRWSKETGITDRHIIGVLTTLVRKGKEISLDTWNVRLYTHLWCDFFPIRVLILKVICALKRVRRKP